MKIQVVRRVGVFCQAKRSRKTPTQTTEECDTDENAVDLRWSDLFRFTKEPNKKRFTERNERENVGQSGHADAKVN
jgi:hypothetical protein